MAKNAKKFLESLMGQNEYNIHMLTMIIPAVNDSAALSKGQQSVIKSMFTTLNKVKERDDFSVELIASMAAYINSCH